MLEDVALARLAKQHGICLHFDSGNGIIRVRMYRTFGAMWQGWAKNLYPLIGAMPETKPGTIPEATPDGATGAKTKVSSRAVGRELRVVIPWIPLVSLLFTPLHLIWGVLGVALLAGRHAAYAATLRRNHFPGRLAIYYIPAVALYAAVLLASERQYARGLVEWKGRVYPVTGDR
jgi:hypothetical protein